MDQQQEIKITWLLYGSNFEEWHQHICSIIRLQGLGAYLNTAPDDEASRFVARFISTLVTPAIISKVPASERARPMLLLQRLQDICTSFRFMDLPAELRNRIYTFSLEDDEIIVRMTDKFVAPYPAIIRVSRQIRAEALPIFYSVTTFKLSFGEKGSTRTSQITPEVTKSAALWALHFGEDAVRQLRSVAIWIRIRVRNYRAAVRRCEIAFTLNRREGLQISLPDRLVKSSQRLLKDHVKTVKQLGEVMGVANDGRLLILALAKGEKLWKYGTLECT